MPTKGIAVTVTKTGMTTVHIHLRLADTSRPVIMEISRLNLSVPVIDDNVPF